MRITKVIQMNKRELDKFRKEYTPCTRARAQMGSRVMLAVHFDEKDEVKNLGARWEPDPSGKGGYWWLAPDKLSNEVHDNGTLVEDLLNDNKMIVGPCGDINDNAVWDEIRDNVLKPTEYHIMNPEDNKFGHFYIYDMGLATIAIWTPMGENPHRGGAYTNIMWLEEGQAFWTAQMSMGYRLVKSEATSEVSS